MIVMKPSTTAVSLCMMLSCLCFQAHATESCIAAHPSTVSKGYVLCACVDTSNEREVLFGLCPEGTTTRDPQKSWIDQMTGYTLEGTTSSDTTTMDIGDYDHLHKTENVYYLDDDGGSPVNYSYMMNSERLGCDDGSLCAPNAPNEAYGGTAYYISESENDIHGCDAKMEFAELANPVHMCITDIDETDDTCSGCGNLAEERAFPKGSTKFSSFVWHDNAWNFNTGVKDIEYLVMHSQMELPAGDEDIEIVVYGKGGSDTDAKKWTTHTDRNNAMNWHGGSGVGWTNIDGVDEIGYIKIKWNGGEKTKVTFHDKYNVGTIPAQYVSAMDDDKETHRDWITETGSMAMCNANEGACSTGGGYISVKCDDTVGCQKLLVDYRFPMTAALASASSYLVYDPTVEPDDETTTDTSPAPRTHVNVGIAAFVVSVAAMVGMF